MASKNIIKIGEKRIQYQNDQEDYQQNQLLREIQQPQRVKEEERNVP